MKTFNEILLKNRNENELKSHYQKMEDEFIIENSAEEYKNQFLQPDVSGNEAHQPEDLFLWMRTFLIYRIGEKDFKLLSETVFKEINRNKKVGEVAVCEHNWLSLHHHKNPDAKYCTKCLLIS